MNKMTVRDADLKDKRVLVRVDFNVPIEGGKITDDTRIRGAVPTIKYILEQKPKSVVLMSHLGRPKGKRDPEFSLATVAPALSKLLGVDVQFIDDALGDATKQAVDALPEGSVALLENTRFYNGDEKNDTDMSKQLAQYGDIFVNDAFGAAHRAHASTVGVADHLTAVAGLLLEKEIDYLATALENPDRPFVAVLGGAKVSDKIEVIQALLDKADTVLIGGGMANTFFKAQGIEISKSLVENDALDTARKLLETSGERLLLPVDVVIGDKLEEDAKIRTVTLSKESGVSDGYAIYDIGPETVKRYGEKILAAKTIVWNGPMGVFEIAPFAKGTQAVAQFMAQATEKGAITIIGGGDSVAAVQDAGLADKITHISTGGGASLEMLEGKTLPGVAALKDK
ncbi:MAG: phosphoglycerate kinase [Burkholderiales bacterium]|nr:phosphoglycerate kinase [Anaerolineae bacterium]